MDTVVDAARSLRFSCFRIVVRMLSVLFNGSVWFSRGLLVLRRGTNSSALLVDRESFIVLLFPCWNDVYRFIFIHDCPRCLVPFTL